MRSCNSACWQVKYARPIAPKAAWRSALPPPCTRRSPARTASKASTRAAALHRFSRSFIAVKPNSHRAAPSAGCCSSAARKAAINSAGSSGSGSGAAKTVPAYSAKQIAVGRRQRHRARIGIARPHRLVQHEVGLPEPLPSLEVVGIGLQPLGQAFHHAPDHVLLLLGSHGLRRLHILGGRTGRPRNRRHALQLRYRRDRCRLPWRWHRSAPSPRPAMARPQGNPVQAISAWPVRPAAAPPAPWRSPDRSAASAPQDPPDLRSSEVPAPARAPSHRPPASAPLHSQRRVHDRRGRVHRRGHRRRRHRQGAASRHRTGPAASSPRDSPAPAPAFAASFATSFHHLAGGHRIAGAAIIGRDIGMGRLIRRACREVDGEGRQRRQRCDENHRDHSGAGSGTRCRLSFGASIALAARQDSALDFRPRCGGGVSGYQARRDLAIQLGELVCKDGDLLLLARSSVPIPRGTAAAAERR